MLLAQAHGAGFELIVSPLLLAELEVVLLRAKFRRYFAVEEVRDFLDLLGRQGTLAPDPDQPAPLSCPDPEDEYLLALAYSQKAVLVTGDSHLLEITSGAPILAPRDFLANSPS
jgi:putative PIN family toxin of toxin-antitoxin system